MYTRICIRVYIYIYMILVIFHCQMWQYCRERADLFSLIFKKKKNKTVTSWFNRKQEVATAASTSGGEKRLILCRLQVFFGFKTTSVVIVCNLGSGWLRLYSVFFTFTRQLFFFTVRGDVSTGSGTREVRMEDSWTLERNPTNHPNPNGGKKRHFSCSHHLPVVKYLSCQSGGKKKNLLDKVLLLLSLLCYYCDELKRQTSCWLLQCL